MTLDDVLPGRRARVLEVGHEDARARVESVDHHLPVDRTGDLATPVGEVGWRFGNTPLRLANFPRLREEPGILARVQAELTLLARREQLEPPRVELAVELLDEREALARENVLGDAAHANCASSVEPLSASVSLSGETACVTRSK